MLFRVPEGLKKQGGQGSKRVTPAMCDAHEDGMSGADEEIRRLFKAEEARMVVGGASPVRVGCS